MKNFVTLFCFLTCISLNVLAQKPGKNKINWQAAITKAANSELKNSRTPSLQIAVGYGDKIIFNKAYGKADIENNVSATPETRYRTASVSKWWTATAAMILVNQGKLELDAPIQKYCSYFPVKQWPITTRQLLTQTSGIRSYLDLKEELAKAKTAKDSSDAKNRYKTELLGTFTRYTNAKEPLDNFMNDSLLFQPGTDWSYSSQGYRVLGCVLEGASGMSYPQLMRKLVFEPANMHYTIEDDTWTIIKNRASGYHLEGKDPIRRADMRDVSENLPAGGHLSTAADLVRFAQAFASKKFFPSATIELMSTPYFKNLQREKDIPIWQYAIPSKNRYGYGMMLFSDPGTIRFGNTGRQAGGSAIVVVIPSKNITIAVMTNSKGWGGYMEFTKVIEDIITKTTTLSKKHSQFE